MSSELIPPVLERREGLPQNVERNVERRIEGIQERSYGSIRALMNLKKIESKDGQEIEYYDVAPSAPEQGEARPLLVVPGFATGPLSFSPIIVGLANRRRVLSVSNPHGIKVDPQKGFPTPQLRKAMAIIEMLDHEGIEGIDAVGHSEGAIVLDLVAQLRPGLINHMVLSHPAGLSEKRGFLKLMLDSQVADKAKKQRRGAMERDGSWTLFHRDLDKDIADEYFGYLGKGRWQSIKEANAMRNANIAPDLQQIQKQGTKVSIVFAEDDLMMPLKGEEDLMQRTNIPKERIRKIKGGHHLHVFEDEKIAQEWNKALEAV